MNKHLEWEKNWWQDCTSTLYEEQKQLVYAGLMGLTFSHEGPGPRIDLQGKSVLDIGGGPVSMLLKTKNKKEGFGSCLVVDPCRYPFWISERYESVGIEMWECGGEEIFDVWNIHNKEGDLVFDEVWIYNVLQHTIDPEKIIQNARKVSKIIRIFEWIDVKKTIGHPHELKEEKLNKWLGGVGQTKQLNESGCIGRAYFGIFKGNHYEEV